MITDILPHFRRTLHPCLPPDAARANFRFYFAKLCEEFPKPPDGTDPDTWAARKNKAMDAALALHPENDAECLFAVRVVSADAQAGDALRCAGLADDPDVVRKCRAQAASMMRQSDSALRSLLRLQTIREKQEAAMHPSTMERAGYWFKYGTSNFNISGGSHIVGGTWKTYPGSTSATLIAGGAQVGNINFYSDPSLTANATYSPTQIAAMDSSGNLSLLGGSSNLYISGHKLFQTGSWTPQLKFGGNSVGITYQGGFPYGSYYRIGPIVFAEWGIWLGSKGSSTGAAAICGLPFPIPNSGQNYGFQPLINFGTLAGKTGPPGMFAGGNGQSCFSLGVADTSVAAPIGQIQGMTDANFGGAENLQGSWIYPTDNW